MRMSMYVKYFAIVIITLIIILSACENYSTKIKTEKYVTEEPLTIRIVNRVNKQYESLNNPVLKKIEHAANVRLIFNLPPINNYN